MLNPDLWLRSILDKAGTREIIEDLSLLSDEELAEKAREYPELQRLVINRIKRLFFSRYLCFKVRLF